MRKCTYYLTFPCKLRKDCSFFIATEGSPPYCFFKGAQSEDHQISRSFSRLKVITSNFWLRESRNTDHTLTRGQKAKPFPQATGEGGAESERNRGRGRREQPQVILFPSQRPHLMLRVKCLSSPRPWTGCPFSRLFQERNFCFPRSQRNWEQSSSQTPALF